MDKRNIITFIIALIILLPISYFITKTIMETGTGQNYTKEKLIQLENNYCSIRNMQRIEYIGQTGGLFSQDINKVKCSDNANDIMIDYQDNIFCEITSKADYFGCK